MSEILENHATGRAFNELHTCGVNAMLQGLRAHWTPTLVVYVSKASVMAMRWAAGMFAPVRALSIRSAQREQEGRKMGCTVSLSALISTVIGKKIDLRENYL